MIFDNLWWPFWPLMCFCQWEVNHSLKHPFHARRRNWSWRGWRPCRELRDQTWQNRASNIKYRYFQSISLFHRMSDPEDSVNLVKLMCHEFFWGSGHTSSDHQSWARQRKRLGPRFELTVARCWDGFLCSKVMALLHQTMGSSWAKKLTMFDDVWWCLESGLSWKHAGFTCEILRIWVWVNSTPAYFTFHMQRWTDHLPHPSVTHSHNPCISSTWSRVVFEESWSWLVNGRLECVPGANSERKQHMQTGHFLA